MKRQRTLFALVDRETGEVIHADVLRPLHDGLWWRSSRNIGAVLASFSLVKLKRVKARIVKP